MNSSNSSLDENWKDIDDDVLLEAVELLENDSEIGERKLMYSRFPTSWISSELAVGRSGWGWETGAGYNSSGFRFLALKRH